MPLLDHFAAALADRDLSFRSRWAVAVADDLNRRLPDHMVAGAIRTADEGVVVEVFERPDVMADTPTVIGPPDPDGSRIPSAGNERYTGMKPGEPPMLLFDHFHGPLKTQRAWTSIHLQWGGAIAADLNRRLPRRFVAETPFRLGSAVEADVAERENYDPHPAGTRNGKVPTGTVGEGGVAVAADPDTAAGMDLYTPPEPDLHMPGTFPDELLVEVRDATDAYRVIAVVEMMSPANKKERAERDRFVAKCLSYLSRGLGLVVLDIVTESRWNAHDEMVRQAGYDPVFEFPDSPPIYAVSYRPVRRKDQNLIDLWRFPLAVGAALPAVPLPLTGYGCVRLDLEATYSEACERCRIP